MAFTSACMIFTASCTGLQTNSEKESTKNPITANNSQTDEIKVTVKKGTDTRKNKKTHEKEDTKNKISKRHTEREEHSDYITTNIETDSSFSSDGLFDERELVDQNTPNSQLVLQKLEELKKEQKKILSEGTSKQKKLWNYKINYLVHISTGKGQNTKWAETLKVGLIARHSQEEFIGKYSALSCQDEQLIKFKLELTFQETS